MNKLEFECISEMPLLADFVEDCLKQDNHAESDQNLFRT